MIQTSKRRNKKPNYFMTDEEVALLWKYSERWGPKWKMMFGFAFFRGFRIGEIVAINILDFSEDYTKIRVVLEKSNIEDIFPLCPELSSMVKDYISMNKHMMKDGYLFPYYTSKKKGSYMSSNTAQNLFCKFRKIIGKDHPTFLDHTFRANGQRKFRISWHSCRRWFETRINDQINDPKKLADIMRYLKPETVYTYLNPYETWKNEQSILNNTFSDRILGMQGMMQGQMKLNQFY